MRRIIINCLLLLSIAAAIPEPDDRHKRHFSYIKNLITSSLFGGSQTESPPSVNLNAEPEYQLYQVPGFDDFLVRGIPAAPVVEERVLDGPAQELNIGPFESYIGTKSPEDTLTAFQNVNNLLSTGILNEQQTNLLKETMIPMISGLKLSEGSLGSFPVISEMKQPVQTEVDLKPYKENDKLKVGFEPKYSYKQVEADAPLLQVTGETNPEVIVKQEFGTPCPTPDCNDQGIQEVISVDNPQPISPVKSVFPLRFREVSEGQYPNAINRFPPSESDEPFKIEFIQHPGVKSASKNIPMSTTPAPVTHFHENTTKTSRGHLVSTNDKVHISQTLAPKPEDKDLKPSNGNVALTANKEPAEQITSRYIYKQASRDNLNAFSMVKEGNELKTTVNTDLPLVKHGVHKPSNTNTGPVIKNTENIPLAKDKDSEENNSEQVTEQVPEKGTLAYFIYQREHHRIPKAFSKVEADQPKEDDLSQAIRYVYIPPDYDRLPTDTDYKNNEKPIDNIVPEKNTADGRVSYVYKQATHNDPNAFSMVKTGDRLITDVHAEPPMSNKYVLGSPDSNTASTTFRAVDTISNPKSTNSGSTKSIEGHSSVSKDVSKIPSNNKPVVIPHSNYAYHRSNPDGSSLTVKGNKEGVSVNVNDNPKTRGDITDEQYK